VAQDGSNAEVTALCQTAGLHVERNLAPMAERGAVLGDGASMIATHYQVEGGREGGGGGAPSCLLTPCTY
jgi:hypothetical protein